MRLAVMQPYFLPYVGYFQLMAAVDTFVILDDVNYMKGGWVNRNRILVNGQPKWLTVPLAKPSPNRLICETMISKESAWREQTLRTCDGAYRRAPFFDQGRQIIGKIMEGNDLCLAAFLVRSLMYLKELFGLPAKIVPTSSVYPKNSMTGPDRVLDICRVEDAKNYVNLPGGKSLYCPQAFADFGVSLRFIQPTIVPYHQGASEFVPSLSILDLLMWNSLEDVRRHVQMVNFDDSNC